MKEILNEWRKFVNENEQIGEEYYIKSMTPTAYKEVFSSKYLGQSWDDEAGAYRGAGPIGSKVIKAAMKFLSLYDGKIYILELSNGDKYLVTHKYIGPFRQSGIQIYHIDEETAAKYNDELRSPFSKVRDSQGREELEAAALKFLEQDAPYENSTRFPEDEEK